MPTPAVSRRAGHSLLYPQPSSTYLEYTGASLIKHRFCLSPDPSECFSPGTDVVLDAQQIHYLVRVLRLSPEDDIEAFSGSGQSFRARINSTHSKHCHLVLQEERPRSAPPAYRMELAQALPKGDKLDLVLQKATELGATHVHLLHSERSEVRLKGARLEKRMQHWNKVLRGATEQSGRRWLPILTAPRGLEEFIATAPGLSSGSRKLIFEPNAVPLPNEAQPRHTTLLIGPEGGWTPKERGFAHKHGFSSVQLGHYILRTETAALAALSAIQQGWGWCNREATSELE